ncbi:MAG TPA: class I SAM-dependent methyltransferase [Nitrososphaeraceae archaeon]|jgi:ubiquinone/menaquinone biosynthesis C-methylase UbiE
MSVTKGSSKIISDTELDRKKSQNIWQLKGPMLERQIRRAQIVRKSLKQGNAKNVLDIGCAEGYTTKFISEGCNIVVGIELNFQSLRIAKNMLKNVEFINASIEYLPFRAECFDTVCILEVLEHLPTKVQRNGLNESERLLQSNGSIMISVPFKEQVIQTTCIHCNKITPLYGHLHSLDVEKISSLVPPQFKIVESYHLPNVQILSCAKIFKPLPLAIWSKINELLGLYKKGYWIVIKYQRV